MGRLILHNILVVCVGNICRSPVGELVLRQYLPDHSVNSAGLCAVVGEGADARMADSAACHGLILGAHYSRQLTASLCQQQDLILVMEKFHIDWVAQISPQAQGKTLLFGQWITEMEIQDPFMQSPNVYEYVVRQLLRGAQEWVVMLGESQKSKNRK